MMNPNALAEAQSASEMFDVMEPPPPDGSFDIFAMKGVPTGEVKARGLVHRDRDWHRSVHVWLVDRDAQLVALQKRSPNKVVRAYDGRARVRSRPTTDARLAQGLRSTNRFGGEDGPFRWRRFGVSMHIVTDC